MKKPKSSNCPGELWECDKCSRWDVCTEFNSSTAVAKGYVAIGNLKGENIYYVGRRYKYVFVTPDFRKATVFVSKEDLNTILSIVKDDIKHKGFLEYRISKVKVTYELKE